jgi:hypothetical protein
MQLECSIVFMLRFSGQSHAILYGLNDRYELVVLAVDWRVRKVVGRCRLAHSGNVAIRDICTFESKGGKLEFITCGEKHLCHWQLRGDCLVYHNFNTLITASYLSVRSLDGYILAGTEEGDLYLWHNF